MNSCQDGASLLKAGPMSNSSHVSPPALGKAGLPSGFDAGRLGIRWRDGFNAGLLGIRWRDGFNAPSLGIWE